MNFLLKKSAFISGLKLPENKITSSKKLENFNTVQKAVFPLIQNLGAPCSFIVARGDKVKTGQVIASSDKYVSAPMHSSLTGSVSKIGKMVNPISGNIVETIEITREGEDQWDYLEGSFYRDKFSVAYLEDSDSADFLKAFSLIEDLDNKSIIEIIKNAGIVGLGGAAFPTHVKLSPPEGKKIDSLIINGCECEPYITADQRIMLDYGREMLAGMKIIAKVLNIKNIYIAVEDNKEDAILFLNELLGQFDFKENIKIVVLKSKYPMGAEKILIRNVLKRTVPIGGLPMDVGVVVQNVGTAKAVFDAVVLGRPLVEKAFTVTGLVGQPKNLMVRMGTSMQDLLDYCGGFTTVEHETIIGGPMMGSVILDLNFPVTKGANCLLVKEESKFSQNNCIRCARCVDICPMKLMPLMYVNYVKNKNYSILNDYAILNCCECGACEYVCPSDIQIVSYIKTGKAKLK